MTAKLAIATAVILACGVGAFVLLQEHELPAGSGGDLDVGGALEVAERDAPGARPVLQASGTPGPVDVTAAARNPDVHRYIEQEMEHVCNEKVARYQTIKKIKILPTTFSVDGGELTPTLKVKRNIVNDKYAKEIAEFYEGGAQPAPQPRA